MKRQGNYKRGYWVVESLDARNPYRPVWYEEPNSMCRTRREAQRSLRSLALTCGYDPQAMRLRHIPRKDSDQ